MPTNSADDLLAEAHNYRHELLVHCYRMLGSLDDAEDALQDTFVRAWRSAETFEGRASLRTWLYRIATNVCLTALNHGVRRVLPSGLAPAADDPDTPAVIADPTVRWIQPFVDDPADGHAARTDLRLALIASLQYLPPRQRAVLILRDVLALRASEVAAVLGMTVPAVKSALQRARSRLDEVRPSLDVGRVAEPDSPQARSALDAYMSAFEAADASALEALLRSDAVLEVTPSTTWFAGKRTCGPYLARHVLRTPGEYRMVATSANGQPAAVSYRRIDGATHAAFAVVVLGTSGRQISRITVFADPMLVTRFGYPATIGTDDVLVEGPRSTS